jgi:hypothetical protein
MSKRRRNAWACQGPVHNDMDETNQGQDLPATGTQPTVPTERISELISFRSHQGVPTSSSEKGAPAEETRVTHTQLPDPQILSNIHKWRPTSSASPPSPPPFLEAKNPTSQIYCLSSADKPSASGESHNGKSGLGRPPAPASLKLTSLLSWPKSRHARPSSLENDSRKVAEVVEGLDKVLGGLQSGIGKDDDEESEDEEEGGVRLDM